MLLSTKELHKEAKQSVSRGAKLLDKHNPKWFTKIHFKLFNVQDPQHCILSQLYGVYTDGLYHLKCYNTAQYNGFCGNGLDDNEFTPLWKAEVKKRKMARQTVKEQP